MDPLTIGTIAAPIIGGLIGRASSGGDRDAAMAAYQNAANQIAALELPDMEKQKLLLQLPQIMGQLNYNTETVQQLGQSEMQNVSTDPRLAQAQMSALQSLADQGNNPLTMAEKAQLAGVSRDTARQQQGANQAILQNLQQRGMGGAGQELAMKLAQSQQGADRQSQEGMQTMAQAQQRALAAIAGAGQLGGQIRSQDFGEQAAKAQAADAIARFNAENSQSVQARNVGRLNEEQAKNLAEQQRMNELQTNLQNQQQQYNKQLIQQDYENRYKKAAGVAGAQQGMGNAYSNQANQTGSMWTGLGGAVGTGLAGYAQSEANKPLQDAQLATERAKANMLNNQAIAPVSSTNTPANNIDPWKIG